MLSSRLYHQAGTEIRSRGQAYFRRGAVQALDGDDRYVAAEVEGTRFYEVSLEIRGRALKVSCTCEYFQGNLVCCKHIWATVLAADSAGYAQDGAGTRP